MTPALVDEHMTLVDELRLPKDDGPVVFLAHQITRHAAGLLALLSLSARRPGLPGPTVPADDQR